MGIPYELKFSLVFFGAYLLLFLWDLLGFSSSLGYIFAWGFILWDLLGFFWDLHTVPTGGIFGLRAEPLLSGAFLLVGVLMHIFHLIFGCCVLGAGFFDDL